MGAGSCRLEVRGAGGAKDQRSLHSRPDPPAWCEGSRASSGRTWQGGKQSEAGTAVTGALHLLLGRHQQGSPRPGPSLTLQGV